MSDHYGVPPEVADEIVRRLAAQGIYDLAVARAKVEAGEWPIGNGQAPGGEARLFPTVDLMQVAKAGIPPPELLCDGLLYRGGLHSLAGEPDSGKGTLLLYWIGTLLVAGHAVVLLDEEGGHEIVTEKLLALGVEPKHLEPRCLGYIEFPGRQWDEADRRGLWALLTERRPTLIGYDSCGALLAAAGRDEDRASDVTPFYKLLLAAAREFHAASVIIDHLPKSQTTGRYARGSGSKLQIADVGYMVDAVKPFSRNRSGLLKVACTKDRRGYIGRDASWEVRVEVEDGQIALAFAKVEAVEDGALAGLPPAARKLYAVLPDQDGALTVKALIDRFADRHGRGLKRQTASSALNQLADRRLADSLGGPGEEKRWWKTPQGVS